MAAVAVAAVAPMKFLAITVAAALQERLHLSVSPASAWSLMLVVAVGLALVAV